MCGKRATLAMAIAVDAMEEMVPGGYQSVMDIIVPGPILPYTQTQRYTCSERHKWIRPKGFGTITLYQKGYDKSDHDIVAFLHNDLEIHEKGWDVRVLREFQNPQVGVVGFGGSLQHGHTNIYKISYDYRQLGRFHYYSNVSDWQKHGKQFTGQRDVATLDGFALIVRRELLEKMGGWQISKWPPHHNYDYRLTLEANRHNYKVRLVGVSCHHHGGGMAVSPEYQEWCQSTKWGADAEMHKVGHRMCYEEYRDVLPVKVNS